MRGKLKVVGPDRNLREWDTEEPETVEQAKRRFEELRAKGYSAFRVKPDGTSERVREFDPNDETLVMTFPLAGG